MTSSSLRLGTLFLVLGLTRSILDPAEVVAAPQVRFRGRRLSSVPDEEDVAEHDRNGTGLLMDIMIICINFLLALRLCAQPAQIGRIGLPRTGRRHWLGRRPVEVGALGWTSSFPVYRRSSISGYRSLRGGS